MLAAATAPLHTPLPFPTPEGCPYSCLLWLQAEKGHAPRPANAGDADRLLQLAKVMRVWPWGVGRARRVLGGPPAVGPGTRARRADEESQAEHVVLQPQGS